MKIVIVDDEPKIRNGLSKLLSSRPGFEIIGVFENAMEALEQLSVSYQDVIITDIKMPEINGLDLINRIREKDENTKIIILSGYSSFFCTESNRAWCDQISDKAYKCQRIDWNSGRNWRKVFRNLGGKKNKK